MSQTIPICNKCGKRAKSKPTGLGYNIFLIKDKCECGGSFVIRKDGEKLQPPIGMLPQCINCSMVRKCDENTIYIPCVTHCIMTGEKLNAT